MDATADPFSLTTLTERSPQVLGLLGARWLLLPPGSDPGGLRGLRRVYDGADATIVENRLAAPRAFVASRLQVADGAAGELEAIAEADFDPRRDATVRAGEVGPDVAALAGAGGGGSARVVDEANAAVTVRAQLPRRGLVVLDDAWAPGWSVEVDGRPASAVQANMVLRGVVVPAGEHEIAWRYRVPGLRLGAALSALGLALAAASGAAAARRCARGRR